MRHMLAEIRDLSARLRVDYDNPLLDGIKERFHASAFVPAFVPVYEMTPAQQESIIRRNIAVATDFYERFERRMELMMERSPQFSDISFTRP